MILAIKRAAPRIAQFLLWIAPMSVGYALLGMIVFGGQTTIHSLGRCCARPGHCFAW